jgi:hypothetical protein
LPRAEATECENIKLLQLADTARLLQVKIFECAGDQQAIQKAQEMADGNNSIELRRDGSLIKKFSA